MATIEISEKERNLITRAGAHALDPKTAPLHLMLKRSVTDLDAARLIHRLERGAVIVPTSSGRAWHEIPEGPHIPRFTIIVEECLRLGLVRRESIVTGRDRRRIQLAAAMVHLRGRLPWVTACEDDQQLRYRVLEDRALVDCLTCLGIHR